MREEKLNEVLQEVDKRNAIILEWPTSMGKSKAAIDIINKKTNNNKAKILLVVAESAHKKNWQKEIDKWGINSNCEITKICYASLKNYNNTEWDIVVLDEAHHIKSELRKDILNTMNIHFMIALSATLPVDIIAYLSFKFPNIYKSKVRLIDAIDNNILPTPKIYLVPLILNNSLYNQELIVTWGTQKKAKKVTCTFKEMYKYTRNRSTYPNMCLTVKCTEKQKYDYISSQLDYYKSDYMMTRTIFSKNKWLNYGSQRKRFLGESKTSYLKKIISKVANKRFICFCSSIDQAKALGGTNAIHSKRSDSLKVIDAFNNKEIHTLYAVGMAQEGMNLVDIEVGIIGQLDGNEKSFIQRFGRVLRAESPIQYILYYKDTRDEEYLNEILKTIDENMVENYVIDS